MRELRVEESILEQQLRPSLRVDRLVQPLKPRVVHGEIASGEWKQVVGSPYSAAKNDSKYAASAIVARLQDPGRIGVLLIATDEQPVLQLASRRRRAPIVRPMRQPRSARYIR